MDIVITSPDGVDTRYVPPGAVAGGRFVVQSAGGYADSGVTLVGELSSLSDVRLGDRLEFWVNDTRLYRGRITDLAPTLGEPDTLELTAQGRSQDTDKTIITQAYRFGAGVDARDVFLAIVADYLPSVTVDSAPVSVNIEAFDPTGQSVTQALNELLSLCGGVAVWGWEVNAGADRIYFRPMEAEPLALMVPGPVILAASGRTDIADLVNVLHLTCGEPTNKNRIKNANFRMLVDSSEVSDNLLLNGDFENGSPSANAWDVDDWTQLGSATVKNISQFPTEPKPFSESWHIETDGASEGLSQSRTIGGLVPGHRYRFAGYCRPENTVGSSGDISAFWDTGSGPVAAPGTLNCIPSALTYQRFEKEWVCPAGAVGFSIEARQFAGSVYWDKFAFWDRDSPAQENWAAKRVGTASATIDWAKSSTPLNGEGAYCVEIVSTLPTGGDEIQLNPIEKITVTPGERLEFGTNYFASSSAHQIRLEMTFRKSDGTQTGPVASFTLAPGTATPVGSWYYIFTEGTAPLDAATADLSIRLLTAGTWRIDAAWCMNPIGSYADTGFYYPDGPLTVIFRATDLVTALEDAEVHNSIATWGVREGSESASEIITLEMARALAKSYFLTRAKPRIRGSVEVANMLFPAAPWRRLALFGAAGEKITGGKELPIAKISSSLKVKSESLVLEIGEEAPTLQALIRKEVVKNAA